MVKFLVQVDFYKFLDFVSPSLHNGWLLCTAYGILQRTIHCGTTVGNLPKQHPTYKCFPKKHLQHLQTVMFSVVYW